MKKPCTGCQSAQHFPWHEKEYWQPNPLLCRDCQKYRKYQEYLKSRQKYERGKRIETVEELIQWLDKNDFVYWRWKILHKGFVYSWQLQMIMNSVKAGVFKEAILKQ